MKAQKSIHSALVLLLLALVSNKATAATLSQPLPNENSEWQTGKQQDETPARGSTLRGGRTLVNSSDNKDDKDTDNDEAPSLQRRHLENFCAEPKVMNFDTDPAENVLSAGTVFFDQYYSLFKLNVTATGDSAPANDDTNKAILFDTLRPPTNELRELGSPNRNCPGGGRGVGSGGRPGTEGENCVALGNVLVIQDSNSNLPKDDPIGGHIYFDFEEPTTVVSIGVFDINTSSSKVLVFLDNGTRIVIRIRKLGNNSVQTIPINQVGVTRVEIDFRNNGAVHEFTFCPNDRTDTGTGGDGDGDNGGGGGGGDNPMDINVYFNKFDNVNGIPTGPSPLPMDRDDYPLTDIAYNYLLQTDASSVTRNANCGLCNYLTPELIDAVGGPPRHPSMDPQDAFWDELLEVIIVQQKRIALDPVSEVMPVPRIWQNLDLAEIAEAVHDEFPGVHHIDLLESFIAEGVTVDRNVLPQRGVVDFVKTEVMMAHMVTWAIATVSPHNFGLKWYVGRARPEEVVYGIFTEAIDAQYVPGSVLQALENQTFTETNFTAYDEGSPKHPSWPAMHSAGSAGSLWMATILDLTEDQLCQAMLLDYAVSYARTVAGVHYQGDNMAGLNLGQEILSRELPLYLAQKYGADPEQVRLKIDQVRFDWNDFLNTDCADFTSLFA